MSALTAFSLAGEWVAGILSMALGPPPPWVVDSEAEEAAEWEASLQAEVDSEEDEAAEWEVSLQPGVSPSAVDKFQCIIP